MRNYVVALAALLAAGTAFAAAWPWTTWTKYGSNPVYDYPSHIASDPTVIKDGATYRMFTSVADTSGNQALGEATSSDGVAWTTLSNGATGIVVPGNSSSWDCQLEMPEAIQRGSEYLLYYSGYCTLDPVYGIGQADIGLAVSSNGSTYTRSGSTPVFKRTPGWYDNDAMTDVTIIDVSGTLYMIYTGWCSTNCAGIGGPGAWNIGATSTDGRTWVKQPAPLPGLGLHNDLVLAPDGAWHVYYNYGKSRGCSNRESIRRSRSFTSPFGPYEDDPTDLLCEGARGAWDGYDFGFPAMLNDNGAGKMWFTGVQRAPLQFKIGLATAQ